MGKYGKIYDRIDGSIIFEWFGLYMDERMGAVEDNRQKMQNEYKTSEYKENLNKAILPALKANLPFFDKKEKEKEEFKQKIVKAGLPNEDLFNKYYAEFEKKDPLTKNDAPVGYVLYNNSLKTLDEYVEYRFAEEIKGKKIKTLLDQKEKLDQELIFAEGIDRRKIEDKLIIVLNTLNKLNN